MGVARRSFNLANKLLGGIPPAIRHGCVGALAFPLLLDRLPRFLILENTNACNLRCPLCPVGTGDTQRERGFMRLEPYRRLIGEISSHVDRILMDYAGEPLLHPQIDAMVGYAEDHGIRVTVGTNGNVDRMAALVDAGLSEIIFSLDGTTEATYQQYRIGGSLARACANLETLLEHRARRGASQPRVYLQFVVMRHNEHEIDDVLALGRRLGVDEVWLQPVCINDFFQRPVTELRETFLPLESDVIRYHGRGASARPRKPVLCEWAFQSVIYHDGRVTVCCFDADGEHTVGNAFGPGGFLSVWQSPEYRKLRRRVLATDLSLCRRCDITTVPPQRVIIDDGP